MWKIKIWTREAFGVTVGASSQKAGQRRAHHWCRQTTVRPQPAQGLLASTFGQRLVAVEGGTPPPAINSISREDPRWSTSPHTLCFIAYSTSLVQENSVKNLLHTSLSKQKHHTLVLARQPWIEFSGFEGATANSGKIHQPLQGTSSRHMEERRRSRTATPLMRLTPPSSTWRASGRIQPREGTQVPPFAGIRPRILAPNRYGCWVWYYFRASWLE